METQNLNMNAFNEKNEANTSGDGYYSSKNSNENMNTSAVNNLPLVGSYNLSVNTSLMDGNDSNLYYTTSNPNINNHNS
jgi:hypothetical protein